MVILFKQSSESHGFSFVSHIWVAYGAPLGGPSGLRSTATSYDVSQATTYPTTSKSFLFYLLFFLHLRIKYSVSLESLNTVELPVSNHPKRQALEVPYERWSSTRA